MNAAVWWTLAAALTPPPEDFKTYLTIEPGTLPIILTAPHGGALRLPGVPDRTGNGAAKFVAVRDTNTSTLAAMIATELTTNGARPTLIVAHLERKQVDFNRPAADGVEDARLLGYHAAYHAAIKSQCAAVRKKWGRGLLIDLHGQAADATVTFRGTASRRTVESLLLRFGEPALSGPKSVLGALAARGYAVHPPLDDPRAKEDPRFNGGHTVRTYGSDQGTSIDAIQLELGGDARTKKALPAFAKDLAAAIRIFAAEYLPTEPLTPSP